MQSKKDQSKIETPELLVQNFLNLLSMHGLISEMTGCIFSDPIVIQGASGPVERGFIENSIKSTGKNPFTNQPMHLDDLKMIQGDRETLQLIDKFIQQFLEANKSHPDFKKLEQLLFEQRYKHIPFKLNAGPQVPDNPTHRVLRTLQQEQGRSLTLTMNPFPLNQSSHEERTQFFLNFNNYQNRLISQANPRTQNGQGIEEEIVTHQYIRN